MSHLEQQQAEYQEYSSSFSKNYVEALEATLFEVKNFCVQMATAYGIIYNEKCKNIPRIKAVVYSPTSDTYYVHTITIIIFLHKLLLRLINVARLKFVLCLLLIHLNILINLWILLQNHLLLS